MTDEHKLDECRGKFEDTARRMKWSLWKAPWDGEYVSMTTKLQWVIWQQAWLGGNSEAFAQATQSIEKMRKESQS